jgi:hypothetical protein
MFRKPIIIFCAILTFTTIFLYSLDKPTVESFFNDETRYEMLLEVDKATDEGRIEDAIDILFNLWKLHRDTYSYLIIIGTMYNDINNPEMAGLFLLEGVSRGIGNGKVNMVGLEENFSKVWSSESFQPYKKEILALINAK